MPAPAAAKAAVFLAYDQVKLDPAVAVVDEEKCRACDFFSKHYFNRGWKF